MSNTSNKEILFIWFGDVEPNYAQWTIRNFKIVNEGWNIRYVKYSKNEILNYNKSNDNILFETIDQFIKSGQKQLSFSYLVDKYKWKYINKSIKKNNICIYCDLDCFPIDSFDNFILTEKDYTDNIRYDNPINKYNFENYLGQHFTYHGFDINDSWCISNCKMLRNRFYQIYKHTDLNRKLVLNGYGIIFNEGDQKLYEERNRKFHECNIELYDNFCNNQFTPIEHYYSLERYKLTDNFIDIDELAK